jgi:hypothetical protein
LRAHACAVLAFDNFNPMPVRPLGTPVNSPIARADCHFSTSDPDASG